MKNITKKNTKTIAKLSIRVYNIEKEHKLYSFMNKLERKGVRNLRQFGIKLKEKRKSLGFLQQDMAAMMNVSLYTYKAYEQGTRTPKIKTLQKIANILECTVDELI